MYDNQTDKPKQLFSVFDLIPYIPWYHSVYKLTYIYEITYDPDDGELIRNSIELKDFDVVKNIEKLSARYTEHPSLFHTSEFIKTKESTGVQTNAKQTRQKRNVMDNYSDVNGYILKIKNRDELKDRGAEVWYQTVVKVKQSSPTTTIETLIPDVKGNWDALIRMISGGQEVVSHNMETVERLYRNVRPQAKYERSLEELKRIKEFGKRSKTGIMLGLGETKDEILKAIDDLVAVGLDVLTLGQYLQPTKMHHEVIEYIHPDVFAEYKEIGLAKGLAYVESGPLVRSSYHAEKHV
jgi:lipoate synthase